MSQRHHPQQSSNYYEKDSYDDRITQNSQRNRYYQPYNQYSGKYYQERGYQKSHQYQQRDRRHTNNHHYDDQENDTKIELQKTQKISLNNEKQYESRNPKYQQSQFHPNTQKTYQQQNYFPKDEVKHQQMQTPLPIQIMPKTQQNSTLSHHQLPKHILTAGQFYAHPQLQQLPLNLPSQAPIFFPHPNAFNQIHGPRTQFETPQSSGSSNDTTQNLTNNSFPLNSQFSTPKLDPIQKVCNHPMSMSCLKKCAQWSLAIKFNSQKAIKVRHSAFAVRQYGSAVNGAQQFTQDIIDAYIQNETVNQTSNVPILQYQNLQLSDFNGFIQSSKNDSEANSPINLPLNNSDGFLDIRCEDILLNQLCENMFCVEFDLSEIPLFDPAELLLIQTEDDIPEANPRVINQALVDSTFHYYVNGHCHGQRILQHDLHYQLQGKKIVKSIQQRIIDYKEYIQKQIHNKISQMYQCTSRCRNNGMRCNYHPEQFPVTDNFRYNMNLLTQMNLQGVGPFLLRSGTLHTKMLNIPKSIGVQFSFDNLPLIEQFLTNFNQLVLQNGIINKVMICFDLPISKLTQKAVGVGAVPNTLKIPQSNVISPMNEMILKDFTNLVGIKSNSKVDIYSFKEDAKPLNLLEEFQRIKVKPNENDGDQSVSQVDFNERTQNPLIQLSNQVVDRNNQKQNVIPLLTTTATLNEFHPIRNQLPGLINIQPQQPFKYDPALVMSTLQFQQQMIIYGQQQQLQQNQLYYQYQQPQMLINPNYMIQQHQHEKYINAGNYQSGYQTQPQFKRPNIQQQLPNNFTTYQNNLDLLLNSITPTYNQLQNQPDHSLNQLFSAFHDSSLNGAKVLLYNLVEEQQEMITMIPTLSSLYLNYFEGQQSSQKNEISDFLINLNNDLSQMSIKTNANGGIICGKKHKVFEYHEERPNYQREPLIMQIEELLEMNPGLRNLRIDSDINLAASWFGVIWTPIKHISINREDSNISQSQLTQQFLVIYSFKFKSSDHSQIYSQNKLEVIGFIPLKDDNLDYWYQPIFSDTGVPPNQLYDSQQATELARGYNNNKAKLAELKDKAIEFLENEGQKTYDYNFFVNQICLYYDTQ